MVVFGGSGPLHGIRVARKLRIPRVICPSGAGVMSAFGLLTSPIGFELVRTQRIALDALDADELARMTRRLGAEARQYLISTGVAESAIRTIFHLDMRYEGQGYEVEVAVPGGDATTARAALPDAFFGAYADVFGTSFRDKPVEVVNWKVEAVGPTPGEAIDYKLRAGTVAMDSLKGRRRAYFPELGGHVDCPVHDRYALRPGTRIAGPALIEERESTCVVGPGDTLSVDDHLNLVIDIGTTTS
jgi:N-methylhydantoinase A